MVKGTCKQLKPTRKVFPEPWVHGRDGSHGWCAQGMVLLMAGCLTADRGFAELQPRVGSGSWGLFPEALSHTWGFLLLYSFFPVPLEGGGGPQCGKVWEEGR